MSVRSEIANKVSELSRENLTLRNQLEEFEKSQDKRIDEIFCEFLTVLDTFERAEQTIKERELDKDETTKKAINRLLNARKKHWEFWRNLMCRKLNSRIINPLRNYVK